MDNEVIKSWVFFALSVKLRSCIFLLQGSESLDCDQVKKPDRVVLMEWTEFPKGEDPDYYIVTYQLTDAFNQKVNVINIRKK